MLDDVSTAKRISIAAYEAEAGPGCQGVGAAPEGPAPVASQADDHVQDTTEEESADGEEAEHLRVRPADIICAFNFSLCLMHSRTSGLQYLRCRPSLQIGWAMPFIHCVLVSK